MHATEPGRLLVLAGPGLRSCLDVISKISSKDAIIIKLQKSLLLLKQVILRYGFDSEGPAREGEGPPR